MSPRESNTLAVGVVRWAPNLHIVDSTHQDLTLHRECLSISFGKGWYQCPVGWVIGTPNFQHGRGRYRRRSSALLREKIDLDELNCTCASFVPIGPRLLPKSGTPAATFSPWRNSVSVLISEKHRTEILLGENPWISGLEYIPPLRYGGVLAISDDFWGDFPRVLATCYHFSGNFHRYVLRGRYV